MFLHIEYSEEVDVVSRIGWLMNSEVVGGAKMSGGEDHDDVVE